TTDSHPCGKPKKMVWEYPLAPVNFLIGVIVMLLQLPYITASVVVFWQEYPTTTSKLNPALTSIWALEVLYLLTALRMHPIGTQSPLQVTVTQVAEIGSKKAEKRKIAKSKQSVVRIVS